MELKCCTRCQTYWSCDTKWFRGERHEENICCERCDYYKSCTQEEKSKSKPNKNS